MFRNPSVRIADLLEPQIISGEIHFKKIHDLANKGFDQMTAEDRTLAWLVLLHIYPLIPNQWGDRFDQVVDPYLNYMDEFKLNDWHLRSFPSQISLEMINSDLEDPQQMVTINIDIMRMNRCIQFFKFSDEEDCPEGVDPMYFYHMEHVRRIERILYIFSKTMLEFGYIQGMNEIAFIFYYVYHLTLPIFKDKMENVESFVYQSLVSLFKLTNIGHLYLISKNATSVIEALKPFSAIIEEQLPELSRYLQRLNIQPVLYSFQWFSIMFTQKHDIPEVLPIWDSLLAHLDCFLEYEFYIGLAHLAVINNRLLKLDYGDALTLLQGKCSTPGLEILRICRKYWIKTHGVLARLADQFKV
ncbi:hypothetical protein M9Y10_008892 [Tritrichomonas musculus]|uniref:Rab-GAP TBC domain-containing protein n=1 Tax=Tritrichomonas musculus TaxID=1915356 RepID=A0ABR2IZA2_9EUKA